MKVFSGRGARLVSLRTHAENIDIVDSGGYFTAANVEAALAELALGTAIQIDAILSSHIDWGTGADQVSAEDVPIADAGGFFTSTDVEATLQELSAATWLIGRFEAADAEPWDQQFNNLLKNGSFESWSAGAGDVLPDGWDAQDAVTKSRQAGNRGSYAFQAIAAGAATALRQTFWEAGMASRTFTASCWVKTGTGGAVGIRVADDVTSTASALHTGSGNWERLTVTRTLDGAATTSQIHLRFFGAATAQFDGAILVEGTICPTFAQHHNDEHLKAIDYQSNAPANVDYGLLRMECGVTAGVAPNNSITITFGTAFTKILTVFCQASFGDLTTSIYWSTGNMANGSFIIYNKDNSEGTPGFYWAVIGVGP